MKTTSAVKILQDLLILVAKRPQHFSSDTNLRLALKSQGGLASINIVYVSETGVDIQTTPMSLNTLKTYSNDVLNNGFKGLNSLRIKALEALEIAEKRNTQINKRTKSGLTRKVEQLEFELEMHRRTNYILLQALSTAIIQLSSVEDAPNELVRTKRIRDTQGLLRAIVGMNNPPFNEIPIVRTNSDNTLKPSHIVTDINSFRK
ncbi:hypothetical protein [Pseudomonas sp. PB101]|uniref:hypothetical protein n=1 Tax=Pseudomonas sp. PB101 TaxID=2495428 RepID=UPI0035321734